VKTLRPPSLSACSVSWCLAYTVTLSLSIKHGMQRVQMRRVLNLENKHKGCDERSQEDVEPRVPKLLQHWPHLGLHSHSLIELKPSITIEDIVSIWIEAAHEHQGFVHHLHAMGLFRIRVVEGQQHD